MYAAESTYFSILHRADNATSEGLRFQSSYFSYGNCECAFEEDKTTFLQSTQIKFLGGNIYRLAPEGVEHKRTGTEHVHT